MVWRRSMAHLSRSVGTAPVPDIDGLRRAALQASWRRDRRVAQRRMAMRWAAWYAIRGLPLLTMAAAVWLWVLPRLAVSAPGTVTPQVIPATKPTPALEPQQKPELQVSPASSSPAKPDPPRGEPGLQLRLESPFQAAVPASGTQGTKMQTTGKAAPTTDSPSPQLKPDNWLHSQEP